MDFKGFVVTQGKKMDLKEDPNPFNHDLFHMGESLGDNCMIMFKNFPKDNCPYLKIINRKTGHVLMVYLDKKGN